MTDFLKKPLVKILMLKGEKGAEIASIEKTSSSGLTDTYTITLTNGEQHKFTVTNGNGINSLVKTGTSGLTDTYTITYDNGASQNIEIKNGEYTLKSHDGDHNKLPSGDMSCNVIKMNSIDPNIGGIGFVFNLEWSDTNWEFQLFMPLSPDLILKYRVFHDGTWGDWISIYSEYNFKSIPNTDIDTILNS